MAGRINISEGQSGSQQFFDEAADGSVVKEDPCMAVRLAASGVLSRDDHLDQGET